MRQAVPNVNNPSEEVYYFVRNPRTQKIADLLMRQNVEEEQN